MPRVILSLIYRNGWRAEFFDCDRRRARLPRTAFFNSDEALTEFISRGGGAKTLEDRNILEMQLKRGFLDVTLDLTAEQYAKLSVLPSSNGKERQQVP